MKFVFADDARQREPSRLGVGPLVAIGGIVVDVQWVGALERELDKLCDQSGFPLGEQFKWSPGQREPFMRTHLIQARREEFYNKALELARRFEAEVIVVIEDTDYKTARSTSYDHDHDVTALFLERVQKALGFGEGTLIVAKPSGGAKDEAKFLDGCLELIDGGTEYTSFSQLPLGAFVAHSRHLRLLQLADIVTSCVVARVAGEVRYSPRVFEKIRPLLRHDDKVGGVGVKIHPDFKYANLYHWLFGDTYIYRAGSRQALPDPDSPFAEHSHEPEVVGEMVRTADLKEWRNQTSG